MPRFSANLGFLWPDRPLLERIEAAADAGYRAIELHYPYDVPAAELKAAYQKRGLELLGLNTQIGAGPDGHRGYAAVPGREADFHALAEQAIAYASEAGGTAVHMMAGNVAPERHAEGFATIVANLKWAAPKAAAAGLTVLIEPINRRDMPGYFYSTQEEGAAVIDAVAAPNVKLMFDAYHVGVAQGDIITRLRTFYPKVGHVQIAAVPSRAEPDEGEVHFPAIFKVLDELGYTGWIGAEYKPRAATDAGMDWVKALGLAGLGS
ncbi:MAG: TIM barrel protein [Rhizobiales bacterium]|nr:TIM barrel protein [Hyphomicrobiales bacterium]